MRENTSRRTILSNWVYRICLAILIFGTFRLGQLAVDRIPVEVREIKGTLLWAALLVAMRTPVMLALCCLALLLRSGAVVWLLGIEFFFAVAPLLVSLESDPLLFMVVLIFLTIVVAIGAGVLTYLIKKQELRLP